MAQPSQLSQHIESFVNLSSSSTHQAASLDAIVSLLKNNVLTIEKLVGEMNMYLTTTDDITRARGMLLLGEVLLKLASKPLDDATIHSLISFFSDRLADWRALRGALVGCLALVKRKSSGYVLTANDAKAVARSYIQNLQVQSLAQHDRKLCFELLEGLLQRFPDAIASLGEDLLYGICEAIDGEKDPQCLMLTFCIVEVVARVFPDDLLASFASGLFEILGCYFPIHFTHSMGEDFDVKRDDLSTALMRAFSSTPLFAPFAIPLLLEKLSSSLPSAKVDSLKYLSSCTLSYGADRIAKHAGAIWSSIKDVIFFSLDPTLSFSLESLDGSGFQENTILQEALTLLQIVIKQNTDLFLGLIIADEDINFTFKSISNFKNYNKIPMQSKQKLHAVGCILSVSVKASLASCNRVIESFFPTLVDALGLSVRNLPQDCFPSDNYVFAERLNHAALYLCIELIAACRDVVSGSEQFITESDFAHEKWCYLIQSFSVSLTKAFTSTLEKSENEDAYDADAYFGVKGLLILGTFPSGALKISKCTFGDILLTLTSIITVDFGKTLLWKLALKALVYIGVSVDRCHESEKKLSYMGIVIDKIVSLASFHDSCMPLPLKLEAISEIGASGSNYLLKIVQGLEEAIFDNLSEIYVHGNSKSAEIVVQLLECYSDKVFLRIHETGSFEEASLRFALSIWSLLENCAAFGVQVHEYGLLDATMKATKLVVASCSVETQTIIVQRAYSVLSSGTSFPLKEPMVVIPIQLKGLQLSQEIDIGSSREEWILSLFASVIIALRPQTNIPNVRMVLQLFMTSMLKGNVPATLALGSIVNKFVLSANLIDVSSTCTLEEAMDIIFNTNLCDFDDNASSRIYGRMDNGREMCLNNICCGVINDRSLQIHAITGLAWIGKGLLMRGHEKVKDITMVLLECLLSNDKKGSLPAEQDSYEDSSERGVHPSVVKRAADAFQILMTDSENCLCRKFHATIRPLYKQRFYSTIMPILQSLIMKSESSFSRSMLYRACAYIISDTPLVVILNEAKKVIPILTEGLSVLCSDILDKEILYNLLLVLSGMLTEKNAQEAIVECAYMIINHLIGLITYSHMMLVRETALQCLAAMSSLPHARIYPMRVQVLQAISKALDDPKRAVRQEAVRCRQTWAPVGSRNLHF